MTFVVVRISDSVCATTVASCSAAPASTWPSANVVSRTGMRKPGPPSVPASSPDRASVLPWLKMMTAAAPASWALVALVANVHVPRCTSATAPALKPAKSRASHPLVFTRSPSRLTSTGTIGPLAVPPGD